MILENRQLVNCLSLKITDHFLGIYRTYPNFIKQNQKMSPCNQSDLQTLGSQPNMPENLPGRSLLARDHYLCPFFLSLHFRGFNFFLSIKSFTLFPVMMPSMSSPFENSSATNKTKQETEAPPMRRPPWCIL
jgi:hypothetical protein